MLLWFMRVFRKMKIKSIFPNEVYLKGILLLSYFSLPPPPIPFLPKIKSFKPPRLKDLIFHFRAAVGAE